jgi:hypothetical protein
MNPTNDIFGSDILLDEDGQAVAAANGELVWGDGLSAAVQDIRLRVFTALGGLFYDQDFGSTLPDYIHDDGTKANRLGLAAEAKRRVEMDARVLAGSVSSKILHWDETSIQIEVNWRFWETEEPQNLTVTLARPAGTRVTEDVNLAEG